MVGVKRPVGQGRSQIEDRSAERVTSKKGAPSGTRTPNPVIPDGEFFGVTADHHTPPLSCEKRLRPSALARPPTGSQLNLMGTSWVDHQRGRRAPVADVVCSLRATEYHSSPAGSPARFQLQDVVGAMRMYVPGPAMPTRSKGCSALRRVDTSRHEWVHREKVVEDDRYPGGPGSDIAELTCLHDGSRPSDPEVFAVELDRYWDHVRLASRPHGRQTTDPLRSDELALLVRERHTTSVAGPRSVLDHDVPLSRQAHALDGVTRVDPVPTYDNGFGVSPSAARALPCLTARAGASAPSSMADACAAWWRLRLCGRSGSPRARRRG